jgi:hypothetical protein
VSRGRGDVGEDDVNSWDGAIFYSTQCVIRKAADRFHAAKEVRVGLVIVGSLMQKSVHRLMDQRQNGRHYSGLPVTRK